MTSTQALDRSEILDFTPDTPTGYVRYVNPYLRFSVAYPADWVPEYEPNCATFYSADRRASLFVFGAVLRAGVTITKEHEGALRISSGEIENDRLNENQFELVVKGSDRMTVIKAFFGSTRRADLVFTYPIDKKAHYEPIFVDVARSFVTGDLNAWWRSEGPNQVPTYNERSN